MSKTLQKLQPWIDARKRFKLTHAQIQMARELGMNPKKFGMLASSARQEQWKEPLPEFIENCYYKQFKKEQPDNVRSIEQIIAAQKAKKEKKRALKLAKKQQEEATLEG